MNKKRPGRTDGWVPSSGDGQIVPLHLDQRAASAVRDWLIVYNLAKQLKALKFRTPTKPSRNSGNQGRTSLSSNLTITCWDQWPKHFSGVHHWLALSAF